MPMIPIDVAKDQLRVMGSDSDKRVYRFIESAESIVLDYLKVTPTYYYTGSPTTLVLPKHVEAAILLVIENLWDRPSEDPISKAVVSLLMRSRDPALA